MTTKPKAEKKEPICSKCNKKMGEFMDGVYICACQTDFKKIKVSGNGGGSEPTTKPNGWDIKNWDKGIEWRNPPSPKAREIIERNINNILSQAILFAEKETVKRCLEALPKDEHHFIEGEEKFFEETIRNEVVKECRESLESLSLPDQEQLTNSKTDE